MGQPIAYTERDGRSWRCDGCGSHGRAVNVTKGHRIAAETVALHIEDCTPKPWALDHQVHLFAQTESRPGPLTTEGEQWMERQPTGKVMVVCQCGYTSGLINHTEVESTVASLAAEHGPTPPGG